MSGGGARILAALGEPFGEAGSMGPETLLERAETQLTAAEQPHPYIVERLEELSAIARYAAERGRRVVWS